MNERSHAQASQTTVLPDPRNDDSCPIVSVIMPAYRVTEYIGAAPDSVLAQTFTDYEIVVVNDGSPDTDELDRVLVPYREHILYLQQENRGAAAARNSGLRIARGRFVAFLDADDIWLSDFLAAQISFMEDTGADLVYADAQLIGDSPLAGLTYMQTAPSQGDVTVESLLALRCNVITSGVLARRQPILEVGMFDEEIRRAHDFDLWVRLAKHGARLKYQSRVLLKHRILENGLSGNIISQVERALKAFETIRKRGYLTPLEQATLAKAVEKVTARLNIEHGKVYLQERNFAGAEKAFTAANRSHRSWKLVIVLLGLRFAPHLFWQLYRRCVTSLSA